MVPLILFPPALVNFKSSTFVHKVLQTSCDIVITFSIVCCCLFFVEFLDHPAQNMYSMKSLMKLPFQQVVIDPKRTPDEEVMVVLLRHYALSRDISERTALKDFTITVHTDLQNSRFLMRLEGGLMKLYNIQFSLMVLLLSWTKMSSQQQHFGDDDDPIARFSSRACFIPIA